MIKSELNSSELNQVSSKKIPSTIKPMLATLTDKAFNSKDWLFEIKFDGYRAITIKNKNQVDLISRNGKSFNIKFSPLLEPLKQIPKNCILDGEVVILDEKGRSGFQLLQNYQRTGKGNLVYYLFDLLYLDGFDLTVLPLIKRKDLLKKLIPENEMIRFSDHLENKGKDFYQAAKEQKLEGIIAKKINSKYQKGKRSKDWLKIKTTYRQEAVIGGYTEPKGSRKKFGALVLGVYEGKDLKYIGHTGGGFSDDDLKLVFEKLSKLERKTFPFKNEPKTNTPVTWVSPELVCEVSFSEWTAEGLMRHPVFLGLREDKNPKSVKRETPDKNAKEEKMKKRSKKSKIIETKKFEVKVSNPDKIYFPDDKMTKADVVDYYKKVSKYILPYLKDRPESLHRHPNGIYEKSFFQKDFDYDLPEFASTHKVYSESADKEINYLVCNNQATLLYMANLGCIEINPWFSRTEKIEKPDYMVLDLDPEEIEFDKVVETALVIKEVLKSAGVKSYCKTSGATGLHVYVPLNAKYDYEISKNFVHLIATIVHNEIPEFTSLERSPSKRKGKVYLDYLQNRTGQTLAAPYSLRPKPGATVATPLRWKEVKKGLDPKDYNIKTIFRRLGQTGDIFKPVLGKGIDVEKAISNLEKKYGSGDK